MEQEENKPVYVTDEDPIQKEAYQEKQEKEKQEQPMGDVYDVYQKTAKVHSKLTDMTEDYTLTRYDKDVYNQQMPKFIREQRKLLRIIKTFLIIPEQKLKQRYKDQNKIKHIQNELKKEYKIIEELLIGELDECVIMGRTPNGDVIKAFLKHGLHPATQEEYETNTEPQTTTQKLNQRG